MFRTVLVANRGEIALRVIRTLREMDIRSVAVFSDADRDALFVQEADEAYRLGAAPAPESYLNVGAILDVAGRSGAQAIHPGYGFLAENAQFAEAVECAGLVFVGPSPHALSVMGDKVQARQAAAALGVPLVPGTPGPVETVEEALEFADRAGYPVAVKAAGGGGGRGIRLVNAANEMEGALEAARREAGAYFKNPQVYVERYFHDPRHVEIQVLADTDGRMVTLGERDCSVQRRHQKLIEEAPGPAVDRALRERMGAMAMLAAQSVGYTNAGTVEFLLSRDGSFYFLEMNTRIQVEHPVTEMVTGIDIVREMVLIAARDGMSVGESVIEPDGHAIEVRVNAEDPANGFRPTPGTITRYVPPGGIGVRVDSGMYAGYRVPGEYDSLVGKVIAWAPDREQARRRMVRALGEYRIDGIATTIPFAMAVLQHPVFVAGQVGTQFLTEHGGEVQVGEQAPSEGEGEAFGVARERERSFEVEVNRKLFRVKVAELTAAKSEPRTQPRERKGGSRRQAGGRELVSPMNGTVVEVRRGVGDVVTQDAVLFVVEAMKMENEVGAHRPGTVSAIDVQVGDSVESGQRLAVIE
jgi:acetyl-CoA/propionyl-CoA carboxylase, biotin carboxylase, biotin carboxyl carrier protein